MASWGVFAYALGKWFLTGLGDYWGGKRNLLIATGGATLFTLLFASGSTLPCSPWRGSQSNDPVDRLVGAPSRCPPSGSIIPLRHDRCHPHLQLHARRRRRAPEHGTAARARVGWRGLFVFGAGVAGVMLSPTCCCCANRAPTRATRRRWRIRATCSREQSRDEEFCALVLPLLRSRAFVMVCLLCFAATMVRETFNTWTPVYLRDFLGYSVSHSATLSAIFPGVGALSVLLAGWASDRLGPNARSLLLSRAWPPRRWRSWFSRRCGRVPPGWVLPVAMIGIVAFCLLGPYSFLPGAFALDFGGKQAGAAASGLVDGTGYLGGIAAGTVMARLSVAFGWGGVFVTLAVVSALAAVGACYLYVLNARRAAGAPG